MAMNYAGIYKPSKAFTNEATGFQSDNGPYIGVVMDNKDPTRSGRVDVWLKSHTGGDKNDPALWRTISYLSPFYGSTPFKYNDKTESKFEKNGHTYGMWFTSPDVGVEVLCFFVDGNPNLGYYVGYVPQVQMNHMIPANGARTNNDPSPAQADMLSNAEQLPVIENSQSTETHNSADFYNNAKPVHSFVASQLWAQGTLTDKVRGPIGSSVQRESPSYAYGISTPGRPIFSGGFTESDSKSAAESGEMNKENTQVEGRRGGHSFTMDDGDLEGNDNLMRFRTSTGHQFTMSDDGACIYMQHANGATWMEFGNEGTIDFYSTNSINLRTHGELNFHADDNINFWSGKDIKMFAKENIKVECDKSLSVVGKQKLDLYSELKVLIKSDGSLSTHSFDNTSIKAEGEIIEDGSMIYMNTNSGQAIAKPEYIVKTTLPESEITGITGWESIPGKLESIVTRAPTHEPYAHHNEGVPVPVKLGTPVTPPEPAPAKTQEKINEAAKQAPPAESIETKDVAKEAKETTNTNEVGNMPKSAVAATMSQQSKLVNQATDAITDKGLGKYGILPKMLEDLDILKPGILDIANTSIGEVFEKLSDPALFSGALGVNSLDDLLNSESLQSTLMQAGMKQANDLLQQSGVLSGAESALETASLLGSAMVASPGEIVDWVAGKGDSVVNQLISEASRASQYAVNLVEGPAKEVIEGITGGVAKATGLSAVGNLDRSAVNKVANAIINNPKIPDVDFINKKVQETIDPLVNNAEKTVDTLVDKAKKSISRFV